MSRRAGPCLPPTPAMRPPTPAVRPALIATCPANAVGPLPSMMVPPRITMSCMVAALTLPPDDAPVGQAPQPEARDIRCLDDPGQRGRAHDITLGSNAM